MKFMRRLPFFTCVRCKTLDGVISTWFRGVGLGN
jgi:hypothetical protein